ncbi:MAG TPA: ABC transporter permease [Streptosporangiaceae bacterium]|nr:ABC transporter permease [Streptosporangiaceae bacterium]
MRARASSRRRSAQTRSRFRLADLTGEAIAGLLQRPGRSALTVLGTVAGIGGFVAIVALSQTAAGQIGKEFNVQDATQVTVNDTGARSGPDGRTMDFPMNADALVDRIHGVVAAGVWWPVNFGNISVSALPPSADGTKVGLPVSAASPGALTASGAQLAAGVLFNQFHEATAQDVAVLGKSAAAQLGISSLVNEPAIFIGGQPFTVIGILADDPRLAQFNLGVTVPESAALRLWGSPQPAGPAQMLIHTKLGAAQVVAEQAAVALQPDDPKVLTATAPVNPAQLKKSVTASFNAVFLALAGVALVIGAVGIANTTLVAVLERSSEIGLRRALGARPRHIATQFLAESTALGLFGGLVGACLGVLVAIAVTVAEHWTALLDARIVFVAPAAGAVIGLLAGLYPALRASTIEPADALRR